MNRPGTQQAQRLALRFAERDEPSPADSLTLREGCMGDYPALAEYHYLRHRPVTATRVLVLEDKRPTAGDRFMQREPAGRVVAILIESLPALSCSLRDQALGDRYRGWSNRSAAARLLNREIRCISRVIVHPQWRGLGLAVRLVRHALATRTTRYTEALAAMGRVHPFFKRAGMTEYRRPPHRPDQRLLDAMRTCGIEPWRLAQIASMRARLSSDDGWAQLLRHELARWAGRRLSLDEQLTKARDELMCEPVYYLDGTKRPAEQRSSESEPACPQAGIRAADVEGERPARGDT